MKEKLTMGFGPSVLATVIFTNLLALPELFAERFLLSDRSGIYLQPTFLFFSSRLQFPSLLSLGSDCT